MHFTVVAQFSVTRTYYFYRNTVRFLERMRTVQLDYFTVGVTVTFYFVGSYITVGATVTFTVTVTETVTIRA